MALLEWVVCLVVVSPASPRRLASVLFLARFAFAHLLDPYLLQLASITFGLAQRLALLEILASRFDIDYALIVLGLGVSCHFHLR